MPRIVAKAERKFFEDLTEKALSALEKDWQRTVAEVFSLDPEEVEVFWETPLRTLNSRPLCLDVHFSLGEKGVKEASEGGAEMCAEALDKVLRQSPYLRKIIPGIWMMPIEGGSYREVERVTVKLDRYTVYVLDPDSGHSGLPCWQIFIEGAPDDALAEKGTCFHRSNTVAFVLKELYAELDYLFTRDELDQVSEGVAEAFREYRNRHAAD